MACLPMAFDKEEGVVISACAIPIAIGLVAFMGIEEHGEYELRFRKLPNDIREIFTAGGWQHQQITRGLIVGISFTFACLFGMAAYYWLRGELPQYWPLFTVFGCFGFLGGAFSAKQLVIPKERRLIKQVQMFGKPTWLSWKWSIQDHDRLAIFVSEIKDSDGHRHGYIHAISVYRGRRRFKIATCQFKTDQIIPGMETSAKRIAKLVDLPYEGYRKLKGFWWW